MLTGPQRKFCEGVVSGLPAAAAYAEAYPKSTPANARKNASHLAARADVKAEIRAMRDKADLLPGSAVLTHAENRNFFARVVRAQVRKLPADSDLWVSVKQTEHGTEFRLPDKLAAIKLDNDLAGEGSEAEANDALSALLERCMKYAAGQPLPQYDI
jgi:hypothetical protein